MITEAKKTNELIARLDQVALGRMYEAAFRATMRIQLYFTGRTHEILREFSDKAQGSILRHAGKEQTLDGTRGFALQADLLRAWGDTWSTWTAEFQQIRREAAKVAFGVQAIYHERLVRPVATELLNESVDLSEGVVDGVYDPQLRILNDVAEQYLYGDGLNLSGRIWRIDREARDGINAVLLNGIQSGDSAWNIAKQLEQYLGTDAECPRWTEERLYGLTKTQIAAGDPTGLLTRPKGALPGSLTLMGEQNPCNGSGVSYNALRLARTEIQKMHALTTDRMMAQQPWITSEKINISPSHGEPDECDEVAHGGEKKDGTYPVGTIELPLHPHCLCFKTAGLMPEKEFTSKLRGWMKGEQEWPGMDKYASDLGVDLSTSLMPAAVNLAVWLFSDDLAGWLK